MRDVSKVFQGLCLATSKTLPNSDTFIRLWIHEMNRVFKDRLVDEIDWKAFDDLILNSIRDIIKKPNFHTKERILFGDFIEKEQDMRVYREVEDLAKLQQIFEELLEDYNNENPPMNLILFSDACEHISRLCRIIGFPRGNALLMGVGGSGRQSCTKIAN